MYFSLLPDVYIGEGISDTEFEMVNGYLTVPSGPGLGVNIDEKALRQLAI